MPLDVERRRPNLASRARMGPGHQPCVDTNGNPGLGMGADDICHLAQSQPSFAAPLCEEVVRKRCGGQRNDPGDEPRLAGDGDDANPPG